MSGFNAEEADAEIKAAMRSAMETVATLLSPIVPHIAEELWRALGHSDSILRVAWPSYDRQALKKEEVLVVIQVNGKLRSKFNVNADAEEAAIKEKALADERVQRFIEGRTIKKVIVVKKKLVNIVI